MWDIDGTLIRGNGSGRIAMNRAFERLYGVKEVFSNMYLAGSLDFNTIQTAFSKYKISLDEFDTYLETYYDELRFVLLEGRSELLPGVADILEETAINDELYNALGTGNVELGARIKLEEFHLNPYFPVGGFSDRPMERFEMIFHGISKAREYYQIDFREEEVFIIGDTVRDFEAGVRCNVKTISVATGGNLFDELQEVNPSRVLKDLSDKAKFFELIS